MISIVVPVYNAAEFVEKTIEIVRNQTYTDWELLLVDDCSTDNSVEIIEQTMNKVCDERIRLIKKTVNAGAAEARNTGIDAAKGRYIAFLDADDLWYPDKLIKELQYMEKKNAGFVFSAYCYGDEEGNSVGKVVHVPKSLSYKQALSRTVIFTSTVLIDTQIVDKQLIHMPNVGSEDSATWWAILKSGVVAYGLDETLAIYRRPRVSLSSNKGVAIKRIWNLYRNVEHLNIIFALFCLFMWAFRATVRRIVSDVIWRYLETLKRFTAVQLSLMGLVLQTGLYTYAWFKDLYPYLAKIRVSQEGFLLGGGLKLYFRGHLLILAIYFLILLFVSKVGDGMKTGYQRPATVIFSQFTALVVTNVITFFQLSLIRNWLIPISPMAKLLGVQFVLAILWAFVSDAIYNKVFPPKEILVVQGSKGTDSVVDAFNMRQDRFRITKIVSTDEDINTIKHECLYWYGAVILGEMDIELRDKIMEFCYSHYIRVYIVPHFPDLLVNSAGIMELLETPLLELKEYGITWENRMVKRIVEFFFTGISIVLLTPSIVFKAIKAKVRCGHVWEKELYIGRNSKEFEIKRFAYKDKPGVTEMLLSVFRGKMSIVGPQALTKKKTDELLAVDSKYLYRLRTKPGITGYAQVFGSKELSDEDMLKYDMIYVQRFSLLRDLKILTKAIKRG